MRQKHIITFFVGALLAAMILPACSPSPEAGKQYNYVLSLNVSAERHADSAQIFLADTLYNKTILLHTATKFPARYESQTYKPQIGFVRLSGDTVPYFFIIEPGKIDIRIEKDYMSIHGGELNDHYFYLLRLIQTIKRHQDENRAEYLKMAADSTLTADHERRLFSTDSLLTDSLTRIIHRIKTTPSLPHTILRQSL